MCEATGPGRVQGKQKAKDALRDGDIAPADNEICFESSLCVSNEIAA
jgi:hypothetical protein